MKLLEGKKALIFGVANNKSIAYAIAKSFKEQGATIGFSYAGEQLKKRIEPISEELGGDFTIECDVTSDDAITSLFEQVKEKWGTFDILVHSVAYAKADDLKGNFINTSRDGFALAMDISAYSLVALCQKAEPLMNDGGSVMAMTYLGATKIVQNYNMMGVAKAALEASTRYLAVDLGKERKIRVNCISAGPIKTLAASGVGGLKQILDIVEERAPLRQNVTQDDVAGTAVYLASDLSKCVTGEVIFVDSGFNNIGV